MLLWAGDGFCSPAVRIGAYASSVCGSLVVLVIASSMPFDYISFTIKKGDSSMEQRKNLCAQVPLSLHTQVTEAREALGQTTSEYITNLLTEYFEMKKNGGKETMATSTRTVAFQISEDLFQRIKAHLERETARTGRKLTQREFVLGLIEEALEVAEQQLQEETGVAPCEPLTGQDESQHQEEGESDTEAEEGAV